MDLFLHYKGQKEIVEIKRQNAYKALERGIQQVARYAKRLYAVNPRGYLILFNTEAEEAWEERGRYEVRKEGAVDIHILWA